MKALFLANAIELLGTALECQVDAWMLSLERPEGGPEGRGVLVSRRAGAPVVLFQFLFFLGGSTERILVVLIVTI